MEAHILEIIRFAVCLLSVVLALILMIRAQDNSILRRLSAIAAAAVIYFNEAIGSAVYLVLGSVIETLIAVMGMGFVLVLGIVIMLLPVILALRCITH